MRVVDLHTHTTASDGSMSPRALVNHAREKGITALAVTDHDTVEGLDEALATGRQIGQEVIPGIEITTMVEDCDVHIVGLFIDPRHPALLEAMESMGETRRERNLMMIDQLAATGINISPTDLDQYYGATLTKAHIADILIHRGYAKTLKEAIAKYMAKDTPGYVRRKTPSPEACIDIIHKSGGLAFIAHINQIDRRRPHHSISICEKVIAAGVDGLETLYCEYDDFWRQEAEALAQNHDLLRSGGSDFHGSYKEGLELATGYGNLKVPYEFVTAMKQRLGLG